MICYSSVLAEVMGNWPAHESIGVQEKQATGALPITLPTTNLLQCALVPVESIN